MITKIIFQAWNFLQYTLGRERLRDICMTMEKHGGQTNDNNNNQKREDIDVSFCPTEFGVVLNVVMFKKSIKDFRAQQCCSSPGFGAAFSSCDKFEHHRWIGQWIWGWDQFDFLSASSAAGAASLMPG